MFTHTKQEILDVLKKNPYLVSFLQKKKLYFKFIKYAMNPKWRNYDWLFSKVYAPESIIHYSFLFEATIEGHNYWDNISYQFGKYYKEQNEI